MGLAWTPKRFSRNLGKLRSAEMLRDQLRDPFIHGHTCRIRCCTDSFLQFVANWQGNQHGWAGSYTIRRPRAGV